MTEYIHLRKARVGIVYKVMFSDDDNFQPGDLVKITKNKRVVLEETNQEGKKVALACPVSSDFACVNTTRNKRHQIPGATIVCSLFGSKKTVTLPGFQSVYLAEDLDA